MRKNVFGRQFKRDANERKALFKNLLTSLVLQERIKTTEAKAKAIRGAADKLVTRAKKGGLSAEMHLGPKVHHDAVVKLINDIAPRFANRQGGYTRIMRLGRRSSDNATIVLMEWTEVATAVPVTKEKTVKKAAPARAVKKADRKPARRVAKKEAK